MIAANKDKVYEVLGFSSFMNQPCFIVADENGKYNTLPITKLLRKREEKVNVKSRNNKGRTNTGAAESITSNQDNTEDSDNE